MTEAQRAQFFAMRKALDGYLVKIVDSPVEINDNMVAIRPWVPGVYAVGDVRMYDGIPYHCKQAHDSTANPDWTPPKAPALWPHYHGTTPETAREFVAEGHNPYMVGHYCTENGKVYRCKQDNTVHAPSVLPGAWVGVE